MRRKTVSSTQPWQPHTWKEHCHLQQTSAFLHSFLFPFWNEHAGLKSSHNSAYSWKPCPKDMRGNQNAAALWLSTSVPRRAGLTTFEKNSWRSDTACKRYFSMTRAPQNIFQHRIKSYIIKTAKYTCSKQNISVKVFQSRRMLLHAATTGWGTDATPGKFWTALTPTMTKNGGAFWLKNVKNMQSVVLWTHCSKILRTRSDPLACCAEQLHWAVLHQGQNVNPAPRDCVLQADVSSKNPSWRVTNSRMSTGELKY